MEERHYNDGPICDDNTMMDTVGYRSDDRQTWQMAEGGQDDEGRVG